MFIQGLCKEWKGINIILNFDTYSLFVLFNILKTHKHDVKEITEDKEEEDEEKNVNDDDEISVFDNF